MKKKLDFIRKIFTKFLNFGIVKSSFLILALLTLLYSCESDNKLIDIEDPDEYFVDEAEAVSYASVLQFNQNQGNKSFKSTKEINSTESVLDGNETPSFYIINYKTGGFIIISADKRTFPILAFSESGSFSLNENETPLGIFEWVDNSKAMINHVREENIVNEALKKEWAPCPMQRIIEPDDPCDGGGGCQDTHYQRGPLLSTTWGQGGHYNDLVPLNCGSDQAPTGCVATAIAQVMRYHEHPSNYNWADMPNNRGTNATAILMRDIGSAVGMNYGCDGSGADSDKIPNALKNNFGYASASKASFDRNVLKQQLRWNRPVILLGYATKSTSWLGLVTKYKDGHAWVCDGYMSHYYCEIGVSTLYLHMNWGWSNITNSDTRANGWFAYNNWDSGKYAFNYKKEMIYNISDN